jgi:hypothetical protein
MRLSFFGLLGILVVGVAGCAADAADDPVGDEAAITSAATITFTADFKTRVSGRPEAGKGLRVEYALERLPQCRGNVGGGGPGWTITGFFSQNGGAPKMFDPTALTPDGRDRVAKPVTIPLEQGGDVALWFEVTSRFGCHEFDSAFGQNYHLDVAGPQPGSEASLVFKKDGSIERAGTLRAGGKLKVRYEQDRLPDCRRVQGGQPVWAITGFAQAGDERPRTFETGRPSGSDRETIDAIVDLPRSGELALWFQVVSIGGCMKFDSQNGANYRFPVN